MSRREAAALLGFASEFKVRQLERQGRLVPVRGIMGSAWYPRASVLALREVPRPAAVAASPATVGTTVGSWSDAALIDHLRRWSEANPGRRHSPTTVDLVAETGVSISRAERVFRFWVTNDLHPSADAARAARGLRKPVATVQATSPPATPTPTPTATASARKASSSKGERRSGDRLERDALLRELKHPDPRVRAAAFARLKRRPATLLSGS